MARPAPELLGIPMAAGGRVDVYSGVARLAGKFWASRHRGGTGRAGTAVLVVHPSSNFLGHYLLDPLAEHGVDTVGLCTRYAGNDAALLLENCVLDVAAAIGYLREEGYQRVVLLGNSGGGGLAALYQNQAEAPSITATPAGDPPDLTTADLPPADALVLLMAHPGRASVYTEWLDPAIVCENEPLLRDPELDMFRAEHGPPYSPEFLRRYRAAQIERNRRITRWVRTRLAGLTEPVTDLPFVVHGTAADPRFLDLTVEPSDREVGTLWGETYQANYAPATLGHHTSLRSWLSQWSRDETRGDGPLPRRGERARARRLRNRRQRLLPQPCPRSLRRGGPRPQRPARCAGRRTLLSGQARSRSGHRHADRGVGEPGRLTRRVVFCCEETGFQAGRVRCAGAAVPDRVGGQRPEDPAAAR
jgi:hypothetical protein